MKPRTIATVLINSQGHLYVVPRLAAGETYEYIYREANGLRWDRSTHALHAHEPDRWEHVELLRHIAATLADAYDEQLQLTEATVWQGVPAEIQVSLSSALK